jgi:hypothetical protein
VPPFRLFLLSSLVFFLILFSLPEFRFVTFHEPQQPPPVSELAAGVDDGLNDDNDDGVPPVLQIEGDDSWFLGEERFDYERMERDIRENSNLPDFWTDRVVWAGTRIGRVYENPALFENVLRNWAPRISFLQMPLFALYLGLLYAWRRSVYMYDHVISSLHLQAFFYLMTLLLIAAFYKFGLWSLAVFGLVPPVYIYRQVRVAYGTGRIMAMLRTLLLISLAVLTIILLVVLLTLAGLADMS